LIVFFLRRRLSRVAGVWVFYQTLVAGMAVVAPCCMAVAASQDEECCPGVEPGEICPMHHKTEGGHHETEESGRICLLTDACSPTSALLLSLANGAGLIPAPPDTAADHLAAESVRLLSDHPRTRAARPEPHPPRA
jgi:hypothetical protein